MKGCKMKKKALSLFRLLAILFSLIIISLLLVVMQIIPSERTGITVVHAPDTTLSLSEEELAAAIEAQHYVSTPTVMQLRFLPYYERNNDFVGWIRVPNTGINYPVVQGSDNAFYLNHDFDGRRSGAGTIFLYSDADIFENNRNLSLFGHYMSNGTKFSALHNYLDLEYYRRFPMFTFSTIYEESVYKIFSVFYMAGSGTDALFYYYITPHFATDEAFQAHINQLLARSIFITPVDIDTDDNIIILTVCTYETYDLRLAVAGRRMRPGESFIINTGDAILNPEPLFPQRWYNAFGGAPPAHVLEMLNL